MRNSASSILQVVDLARYRPNPETKSVSVNVDEKLVKETILEQYKGHDRSLKTFVARFTKEISKLKNDINNLKKSNKSLIEKIQMVEDSMKPLSEEEISSSEGSEEEKSNSKKKS